MNISLVILPSLVTNEYLPNNGLLKSSSYANGDAIRYGYTNSGLVSQIYVDNNAESTYPLYTWAYSSNGLPRIHKDGVTGYKYDYSYDSIGRLIRTDISKSSDSSYVASTEYGYDVRNNLTSIVNDIGGNAYKQIYGYYNTGVGNAAEDTKDNLPTRYLVLGVNTDYYYNSLNQLYKREVGISSNPITNTYTYNTVTLNNTLYYTNQLAREDIENDKYYYTYDNVGNITLIKKAVNAGAATNYREYSYDNLNRLKTETLNGSTVNQWTYDGLGNILTKTTTVGSTKTGLKYNYGADSDCGWNNLLTSVQYLSYNGTAETVTKTETIDYDAIGNPLTYRGATLNWYGRQLKTFIKNGTTIAMTYDADGLRSSKTVAGVKTTYQYVGDKLFYENRGNGDSFYYFYDSYGKLAALYHNRNGTKVAYHVVTNAQGDVVALYSWAGTKVADSTSTGIATLNPFRYRGYYYDTDLGLYYLQSRYYDAEIGRFINADEFDTIIVTPNDVTDKNMYAYCDNNPVVRSDNGGNFWHIVAGAAIGGIFGGISSIVGQAISGQKINWAEVGVSAASGALTGAITAACPGMGAVATGIVHGIVGAGTYAATELVNGRTPTIEGTLAAGVTSGVLAGGTKAFSQFVSSKYLEKIVKDPQRIQGQSLGKVKLAAELSPQWKTGTLTKGSHAGMGWKATAHGDWLIQWHPGSKWHYGGAPYWKVSSGANGTLRFPY